MSTTETGRIAEVKAADYLRAHGYKILERNWRTRWCEVDIIAERKGVVYFVEVKYRASDFQGSGLEYITPAKLRQMHFAAELWVSEHKSEGDYRLAALELSGPGFVVTAWIDEL